MNREDAIKIVKSHYPANKQILNEALGILIPELKEDEDELTWLKNYISEEAYSLSMDIRDNEDRIKLKKLQKSLAWLETQGKNNIGISEDTKKKLLDNLNKALAKETPESWNEFLDKQGEQKSVEWGEEEQQIIKDAASVILSCVNTADARKEEERLEELADKLQDLRLRKQWKPSDEQKDFAPKTETKFHEGEWLQYRNAKPFYVEEITSQGYVNGNSCLPFSWEDEIHLWAIQDAKEGDVLSYVTDEEDLWIMIYWSLYKPYEGHVYYHALLVNDNFTDKGTCCICIDDLKPATKEQRDLLFAKMRESGYEWDNEKKQLITLNHFVDNNDMVEPKFKDGDWIVYKDAVWKVCNIGLQNYYELLKINNEVSTRLIKDVDENAHLWTIQDAKDGDVLASENGSIILVKESRGSSWGYRLSYHCAVLHDGTFEPREFHVNPEKFFPASKEQRDILFTKMKEEGYTWDSEKKELKSHYKCIVTKDSKKGLETTM